MPPGNMWPLMPGSLLLPWIAGETRDGGLPPGEGSLSYWRIYKKMARYVVESRSGYAVTALLTFFWFYVTLGLMELRSLNNDNK